MSDPVDDPFFRQRYRFSRTGAALQVEMWTEPGGGVSADHFHPHQEERFRVLQGEITFRLAGEERRAGPGDELVVAPGAPHAFENTGPDEAHLLSEVRPPLRLQEQIEEGAALARAGRITVKGRPAGLGAFIEAAEMMHRYRDVTVLLSPPRILQRVLFPLLAWLQRRRRP